MNGIQSVVHAMRRPSRRAMLRGALALPAGAAGAALAACGGPGASGPAAAGPTAKGKVLVLSYQQTAPLVDRQVAMYEAFNQEMKPKGLEVEFVNPAVASNDLLLAKF